MRTAWQSVRKHGWLVLFVLALSSIAGMSYF